MAIEGIDNTKLLNLTRKVLIDGCQVEERYLQWQTMRKADPFVSALFMVEE